MASDEKKPRYPFGWGVGLGPTLPFSRDHGSTEKWEHVCPFPTNREAIRVIQEAESGIKNSNAPEARDRGRKTVGRGGACGEQPAAGL